MSLVTTNPETTEHTTESAAPRTRIQAYVELTKLRISVMVLLTFACAAVLEALVVGVTLGPATLLWRFDRHVGDCQQRKFDEHVRRTVHRLPDAADGRSPAASQRAYLD